MWNTPGTWQRHLLSVAVLTGLVFSVVAMAAPAEARSGVSVSVGVGHHHGHHYYPRSYYHYRPYFYRPYYYRPYYYRPYYYGHYGYHRAPYYVGRYDGALDLNVRPKNAEVYVDGKYVGTVGEYDGWPRYLWLEEGSYELILFKEGYETVVRDVSVRPDRVINLKLRLHEGPSTPVAELTRYPEGRERERYDRRERDADRDERYDRRERDERYDRRERDERDERYTEPPRREPEAPRADDERGELDLTEPGRVHLAISPAEAAVYLDGRFVGIAAELAELTGGLLMDPGEHEIQVVHPGYRTLEQTFDVEADAATHLELELER